ncbi:helix-turn-helix domain-containing protein, partial [Kistimonas scapharcae]|uniref:helix-turn-helix domain-containing protein n=1 Tax=Kistimonas scapharcae TaxID=1036133 RepID=UPI0031ED0AC3
KAARKSRAVSQAELARLVGTRQSTINDIEHGRNKSTKYLLAIADALKVDPRWLERGEGVIKGVSVSIVHQGVPLPMFSWDMAARLAEDEKPHLPMVDTLYRCPVEHSTEAYTLTVTSDQYEGYLSNNDVLFVDPIGEYSANDVVICVMPDSGYIDVRQIFFDGVSASLRSLTRDVPPDRRIVSARIVPMLGGVLKLPVTTDSSVPELRLVGRVLLRAGRVV